MRIVIALIWLVIVTITFGQAPIQRSWYTTNVTGTLDPRWTNIAGVLSPSVMTPTIKINTNGLLSVFPTGTNDQAHITNSGFSGSYQVEATRCKTVSGNSALSLGYFVGTGSGIGNELPSFDITAQGRKSAIAIAAADDSTNCLVDASIGGMAAALFDSATNCSVNAINGGAWAGLYAVLSTDCRFSTVNDGAIGGSEMIFSVGNTWGCTDGSIMFGRTDSVTNIDVLVDNGALMMLHARGSSNTPVRSVDGSILSVFIAHATNTAAFEVAEAENGSLAVGIVKGAEKLWAYGSTNGVGAMAIGRDIASTNNWTIGLHDTNTIPLSFRVGYNGVRALQVESNLNTTVHALKVGLVNQGTLTNVLFGSATLNFASTSSGAIEDLAITVTGAADGDIVSVGPPVTACTGIIGSYSGFASNDTVFVRFTPTAATQNPNSGTFKVMVHKFQ